MSGSPNRSHIQFVDTEEAGGRRGMDGIHHTMAASSAGPVPVWRRPRVLHWVCHGVLTIALVLVVVLHPSHDPPLSQEGPLQSKPRLVCDGTTLDDRYGVCSRNAMVTTSDEYATKAALEILKAGGNAVDAAAAAQLMLSLTQPLSAGIGGGCFVMIYNASTKKVSALDGREEAPAQYTDTFFCTDADGSRSSSDNVNSETKGACTPMDYVQAMTGGMAVGVPGVPHALGRMLREHGTMNFAQVAAPTIRQARAGYRVSQFLYDNLLSFRFLLLRFPATRDLYFGSDGQPKARAGQLMYNEDYAHTLELLGSKGVEDFYTGELAQDIITAVNTASNDLNRTGVMTPQDMSSYRAVYRRPLRLKYRDLEVMGMPPPTSGPLTLGYILATLESLRLGDGVRWLSSEYFHRVLDAEDMAFADRKAWMADPDFFDVPVEGLSNLTYIKERARDLLRATTAAGAPLHPGNPPGTPAPKSNASSTKAAPAVSREGPETSHLNVVDTFGNVVAMTTSIQTWFGSGIVVPGRGFLLNNQLTDFDFLPGFPNSPSGDRRPRRTAVAPDETTIGGKRPRSSMTPTMTFRNGRPVAAVGGSGGSTIIGGVLGTLLSVMEYDRGAQEAVDAPRAISRNDAVCLEPFLNHTISSDLRSLGFQFRSCHPELIAVVQLIKWETDPEGHSCVCGASDRTRLPSALASGY